LVRRKWTFQSRRKRGRPRSSPELEALVLRLAQENGRWGVDRIHGELLKLGFRIGATTIRAILRHHGTLPAPQRGANGGSWRRLLKHYQGQILACDFFTVETALLQTVYVLFFINLSTRRIHLAGCTAHPTSARMSQQARQLLWSLSESEIYPRFLIQDRDTKFSRAFDAVFLSEGIDILLTPFQTPNANAFAERWVRTVRQECLDHVIILNEAHLRRVLNEFVLHYNTARPHQGIHQQLPIPPPPAKLGAHVHRRDRLGDILHEYFREAA
jgi:transposase InsO family protein